MGIPFSNPQDGVPPIINAKSLFSNWDKTGALVVLGKAAVNGNVMACYDAGFMMIQGIGCKKNWDEGIEMLKRGWELEEQSENMDWKSDGSVTELFQPQTMNLCGLFN